MVTKEDALSFASSITKALAEVKGHTHFLKTFASLMRRYSRSDQAYVDPGAFIIEVVREYHEYLSNLCISIERLRSMVRDSRLTNEEERALLLIEANAVLVAVRKVLQTVEGSVHLLGIESMDQILNDTYLYIPGLPVDWVVSKKGTSLVVEYLKEMEMKETS
ncbi:hypothetical protein [Alkalicoccobacillus plakortidis]|uniref:Uncharacterized protein n=1 Tax=Alkalicoccobacillus plakortidis TaxID=444060 RepID=A0ABT0XIT3_9BACI|nr:hypothetical protein [Alkalicoccobacillus plakortidis]MCM2675789.1 hypothetical protein [Alkalicoccobacillus plakortidis]